MSDLRKRILDCVSRSVCFQSTVRIARRVGARRSEVAKELKELCEAGLVEKKPTGWRSRGGVRRLVPDLGSSDGKKAETGAVKKRLLTGSPRSQSPTTGGRRNRSVKESRWGTFRRLCLYYAECVEIEERPSILAEADKAFSDYVEIPLAPDWRALASGQEVCLSLPSDAISFLRSVSSGRSRERIFLGAPLYVHVSKAEIDGSWQRLVSPVFTVPVEVRLSRDLNVRIAPLSTSTLDTKGAFIEVNSAWLERAFRSKSERDSFLDSIGLLPVESQDDGSEERLFLADFAEAARLLFGLRKQKWQEYCDLGKLCVEPPIKDIEKSGYYNRAILIRGRKLRYGKRLVDELRKIAETASDEDLDRTALASLFPSELPDEKPPLDLPEAGEPFAGTLAQFTLLDESQRKACSEALQRRLTVVTGPPGTGKSVVVSHVLANQALAGRSAVFASRNHQALEAVEPKLNKLASPECIIIRANHPYGQQNQRFRWYETITEFLARPGRQAGKEEKESAVQALREILEHQSKIEELQGKILDLEEELVAVETDLREKRDACPPDLRNLAESGSLPSCSRKLEKIANFLDSLHRPSSLALAVLSAPYRFLAYGALKRKVARLVAVLIPSDSPARKRWMNLERDMLGDCVSELLALSRYAEAVNRLNRLKTKIRTLPERSVLTEELAQCVEKAKEAVQEALRTVAKAAGAELPPELRKDLANLRAAFKNSGSKVLEGAVDTSVEKTIHNALSELLKVFPLWAVSNLSISKAAPLKPAFFDLAVIDEASQCDIPSIIPVLFRARRAFIVGDPNQLRHVVQLSRTADEALRLKYDLTDFRLQRFTFVPNSCYDLAASACEEPLLLERHYRSRPGIIGFCNAAFYSGGLIPSTDPNEILRRLRLGSKTPAMAWVDVACEPKEASRGCYCPVQIKGVIQELQKLAKEDFQGTVGVVTPFRAHANRVNDAVHEALAVEVLKRWRFLASTADGFQGDERDVIIFSLVGAEEMPRGSLNFLQSTSHLFNVAVSRARAILKVLGDASWANRCGIPHIQKLFEHCTAPEEYEAPRKDLIGPVWEPRLAEGLRREGLPFYQQYPACGFYLDFALFPGEGVRIDVEVDGETFHRSRGGGRKIEDIQRDIILRMAGWKVLRFWVYQLREDLNGCLGRIREEFERPKTRSAVVNYGG